MDASDRSISDRPPLPPAEPAPQAPSATWTGVLPPAPFVDPASLSGTPQITRLSPRVAVLIVGAIIFGVLFWMARGAIQPFVVGLLLVYLLDPPVRWLVRRGIRRTIAIGIVYVVVTVAFIELLNLTLTPLLDELLRFVDELPQLVVQLQDQLARLNEFYARLQIPDAVREWIDALIASLGDGGAAPAIDLSFFLPIVTGAGGLVGAIFGYILLPVWVFYLLKDRVALTAQFDVALPATWRFDVWAILRIVQRVFGQWVRGQLILGFTVGVFTFVGLLLLSVTVDEVFGRYAILLSVSAAILELLPIIGPIIAAVPAVLLAATAGLEAVIAALVLYTLVQQVENNFLVPKIQGDAVQLHPAAVIFAIIVGGAIAGLLGAILALPIAAALRDVLRYLFRRLTPDSSTALAESLAGLGLERHPGLPDPPGDAAAAPA